MHRIQTLTYLLVATIATITVHAEDHANRHIYQYDMPDAASNFAAEVTLANIEIRLLQKSDASDRSIDRKTKKLEDDIKDLQTDYAEDIKRDLEDIKKDDAKVESRLERVNKKFERADGDAMEKITEERDEILREKSGYNDQKGILESYKKYGVTIEGEAALPEALITSPAPEFTLLSPAGKEMKLSDITGTGPSLLIFLSLENRDSISTFKSNVTAMRKFTDVKVVGIAIGHSPEVWAERAKGSEDLPVLLDTDGKIAAAYHVGYLPQVVVLDTHGEVEAVFVGAGSSARRAVGSVVLDLRKAAAEND